MNGTVLTEVSAVVAADREPDLVAGFETLLKGERPDGLMRTELLSGGGRWRIQSLWRDRAALDAMRASGQPPAAPALFRSVGADPVLEILVVAAAG